MPEYLDILDDKGKKTGSTAEYNDVHKNGQIHRTVHVWFINSKKQILVQKRSANKSAYPSLWDISVAGHVSSGETSLEAAKKEVREEVGIELPDQAFTFLATLKQPRTIHNKDFIDDEFNDVYIAACDADISDLTIELKEVEEVRWLELPEFKEWVKGRGEPMVPHEEEYGLLLSKLIQ